MVPIRFFLSFSLFLYILPYPLTGIFGRLRVRRLIYNIYWGRIVLGPKCLGQMCLRPIGLRAELYIGPMCLRAELSVKRQNYEGRQLRGVSVKMATSMEVMFFNVSFWGYPSIPGPKKVFMKGSREETVGTAISRILPDETLVVRSLKAYR